MSWYSFLTISWFTPLLKKGWKKPLEAGDLLPLPHSLTCSSAYHHFLRGLSALPEPPAPASASSSAHPTKPATGGFGASSTGNVAGNGAASAPTSAPTSPEQHLHNTRALLALIWRLHGVALRRALALIYAYQACVFFQPLLLEQLTNQLVAHGGSDPRIWLLPVGLFISPLVGSLCKAQSQLSMIRIQIGLRSQLTAAVYRKCLRLSAGARASMPSGRVVNLMSADVAKICDFLYPQLTFISAAPLAVVVSLVMLWFRLGWATVVGLCVLLLSTPVSNIAVRATQRHRNDMLTAADGRMKLVGQFLAGVRVIKMYHWEAPQEAEIDKCRSEELRALRNMIPSKVAMQTLLYVLPQLAGVLSLLAVALTKPESLTPGRAFSALVLFQIMRFPLLTLSTGLVELGAAVISSRRITAFMAAEEQQDYVIRILQPTGTTPTPPPRPGTGSGYIAASASSPALTPTGAAATPTATAVAQEQQHHAPGAHSASCGALTGATAGGAGGAAAAAATAYGAHGPSPLSRGEAGGGGSSGSSSHLRVRLDSQSAPHPAQYQHQHQPPQPLHHSRTDSDMRKTSGGGAGGGSGSCTPRGSRNGYFPGVGPLVGVEPGLTVRARGFKWAAVLHPPDNKDAGGGGGDGGKGGSGGGGGGGKDPGGPLRRMRSQKPFMEVVDAAGESLAAGASALGVRLQRAITRRRDLDAPEGTAYGGSPMDTPRGGAGNSSSNGNGYGYGHSNGVAVGGGDGKGAPGAHRGDEEKMGLLAAVDGSSGNGVGGGYTASVGGGGPAATPTTVMVACDSASSDSGSGTVALAPRAGGQAVAIELMRSGPAAAADPHRHDHHHKQQLGGEEEGAAEEGAAVRPFELDALELRVRPGELVCVVGRVGSGKSSLLAAALGEMEPDLSAPSDVVGLGGRVAYVAQTAWVLNATLADNVTLGAPLEEAKWSEVVQACALGPDLELLPSGRDTEIGEKGVNLSGGQKQRLALARAMYQDADIYLLDDPLSAVDVHVGAHIFKHVVRRLVQRGAAVLLVTNAVQYLPSADQILVLDGGRVVVQGTYTQCLSEPLFSSMLEEFKAAQDEEEDEDVAAAAKEEGDEVEQVVAKAGAGNGIRLPSACHGVATDAVAARRASVDVARQAAAVRRHSATGGHVADLDEANEMMDSLLRMSGDGGGGDGVDGDSAAEADERAAGSLRGIGGAGTAAAAAVAASRREEKLPLLSSAAAVGYSSSGSKVGAGTTATPAAAAGGGAAAAAAVPAPPTVAAEKGRITVVEDRELGQVKWRVYGAYLSAFHWAAAVAMLLFWSAEQGTRLGTNAWLAHWSRDMQRHQREAAAAAAAGAPAPAAAGMGHFTTGYLLLGAAYALATFLRSTTNNLGSYRASKLLHHSTLTSLMAAPLSFFEATPVGRILNRLSRDVDEMDYNLAMYQQQLGNCVMRLIATIIFLCVLQPAFIGVVVPLMVGYLILQKFFRRTSIELQRVDAVSRSPVYANFSETMSGLDTIRAYRLQERFKSRHEGMVDTNATAYYNARVADEWLSLRLDLIGSIIVFSIAALNVALAGHTSPALVALALSEAIDLTSFLNYAVKVSALVESRYNAVERLLAYAALAPEEPPQVTHDPRHQPPHRPPGLPAWPASGSLEFRDVVMSYRPGLDPVLRGVSFRIEDGQKVGIVGRTGSGKSSLIVALFRLVEPQQGQMLLDGIDLRSLALGPARTALSAIPQEPVLFSGTVRSNLDPFDSHTDPELWAALGVVALKDYVKGLGGLSAPVAEGGGNFSVGQRQLVCVARALLRKPRLLVADEATASVDPETDGLIQRAIRTHFKSATVLAIAHRLNTILDSDLVLLMDAGRVAEFGPVQQLLAAGPPAPGPAGSAGSAGSMFARMVADAGLLPGALAAGAAAGAAVARAKDAS
ncbi:hypothetical protein HYH02_000453 [Chlamydomonas schloesseri]|uniref:ABC transporter n=1 Tax=Chlamydomonas schloesseri TaxID=2026947 RepID=A0A836BCM0_9CHLO|nr:hypothetical protein HYH02_000453 [Chlamydomonas schloesseri]|eukprot:KAG2454612.1 hypothetical protein HYH02_000453 [Chlamydomonas schloesseri]